MPNIILSQQAIKSFLAIDDVVGGFQLGTIDNGMSFFVVLGYGRDSTVPNLRNRTPTVGLRRRLQAMTWEKGGSSRRENL